MSRRPQREQTVQRKALTWLARRYRAQSSANRILGLEEAKVVHATERGRADGLIVFEREAGVVHTVAIEAKSSKLTHQVRGRDDGCGPAGLAMLLGFVIGSGAAGWFVASRVGIGWGLLAALPAGVAAAFVALVVVARSSSFITHEVIEQVERYPGAERWIALPRDMMTDELHETFTAECRKRGVGLLVVPRRGEPVVEFEPQVVQRDDALARYARAAEIRERLRSSKPGIHVRFRGCAWETLDEGDA